MNKTLAGFFGIKEKAAAAVVDALVNSLTGDAAGETKKDTTAEGTVEPAEEIEPTVAEAVTGGDTDAPVEASVGQETLEEVDEAPETEGLTPAVIEGEELETPPDVATPGVATPGVEMASLPAAELSQIQADAASWNANKGEFAVLSTWYKNTTGTTRVGATTDAADATPEKKKSWERAAWNN